MYLRLVLNLHRSKSRKTTDVEMKRLNALTEKNHFSKFAPGDLDGDAAGTNGWTNGGSAGNGLGGVTDAHGYNKRKINETSKRNNMIKLIIDIIIVPSFIKIRIYEWS